MSIAHLRGKAAELAGTEHARCGMLPSQPLSITMPNCSRMRTPNAAEPQHAGPDRAACVPRQAESLQLRLQPYRDADHQEVPGQHASFKLRNSLRLPSSKN